MPPEVRYSLFPLPPESGIRRQGSRKRSATSKSQSSTRPFVESPRNDPDSERPATSDSSHDDPSHLKIQTRQLAAASPVDSAVGGLNNGDSSKPAHSSRTPSLAQSPKWPLLSPPRPISPSQSTVSPKTASPKAVSPKSRVAAAETPRRRHRKMSSAASPVLSTIYSPPPERETDNHMLEGEEPETVGGQPAEEQSKPEELSQTLPSSPEINPKDQEESPPIPPNLPTKSILRTYPSHNRKHLRFKEYGEREDDVQKAMEKTENRSERSDDSSEEEDDAQKPEEESSSRKGSEVQRPYVPARKDSETIPNLEEFIRDLHLSPNVEKSTPSTDVQNRSRSHSPCVEESQPQPRKRPLNPHIPPRTTSMINYHMIVEDVDECTRNGSVSTKRTSGSESVMSTTTIETANTSAASTEATLMSPMSEEFSFSPTITRSSKASPVSYPEVPKATTSHIAPTMYSPPRRVDVIRKRYSTRDGFGAGIAPAPKQHVTSDPNWKQRSEANQGRRRDVSHPSKAVVKPNPESGMGPAPSSAPTAALPKPPAKHKSGVFPPVNTALPSDPEFQSIFPAYNPAVPLAQQDYRPNFATSMPLSPLSPGVALASTPPPARPLPKRPVCANCAEQTTDCFSEKEREWEKAKATFEEWEKAKEKETGVIVGVKEKKSDSDSSPLQALPKFPGPPAEAFSDDEQPTVKAKESHPNKTKLQEKRKSERKDKDDADQPRNRIRKLARQSRTPTPLSEEKGTFSVQTAAIPEETFVSRSLITPSAKNEADPFAEPHPGTLVEIHPCQPWPEPVDSHPGTVVQMKPATPAQGKLHHRSSSSISKRHGKKKPHDVHVSTTKNASKATDADLILDPHPGTLVEIRPAHSHSSSNNSNGLWSDPHPGTLVEIHPAPVQSQPTKHKHSASATSISKASSALGGLGETAGLKMDVIAPWGSSDGPAPPRGKERPSQDGRTSRSSGGRGESNSGRTSRASGSKPSSSHGKDGGSKSSKSNKAPSSAGQWLKKRWGSGWQGPSVAGM